MAAQVNGRRQLWLRALDALQVLPMPGTEDATFPFWSPDGRYIGFFAQGKLKKIAAGYGLVQSLCDAPAGRGGSWNRADVIVFSPNGGEFAIQRVSASGGVPVDVTQPKSLSRFPVFLPDGRHFLYLVTGRSTEQNGVYLSSLDGKENRRVLADESSVALAADKLLFVRENTLMAQPFDVSSGQTKGDMLALVEGVSLNSDNYAPVSASDAAVLLYGSGALAGGHNQMAWYDRGGNLLGAVGAPGPVWDPGDLAG
jgi:hypothetical protein